MAAQRRSRKPLRSELSEGIRKNREAKPIKTIVPTFVGIEQFSEPIVIESKNEIINEEIVEDPTSETDLIEDQAVESSEEDAIRAKAKELGISNWWNKKIETLEFEIEEIQMEDGEE